MEFGNASDSTKQTDARPTVSRLANQSRRTVVMHITHERSTVRYGQRPLLAVTGAEVDDVVTVAQLRVMMMIATLGAINFAAAQPVWMAVRPMRSSSAR